MISHAGTNPQVGLKTAVHLKAAEFLGSIRSITEGKERKDHNRFYKIARHCEDGHKSNRCGHAGEILRSQTAINS
jgi:hypothetical protein